MMTSQVLRRLEARGLLERRPDPNDARTRRPVLSTSGVALVAGALAAVEQADRRHFERLGARLPAFVGDLATLADPT
jgi:DNA-binding MarR family transcriptional regulator